MVVPGDPQFPAGLHQTVQRFVCIAVTFDNVMVEHQIVRRAVAHQNVTVAVQNIAAGSTDCGNGTVDLGIIRIAVGLDDLQHEQPSGKQHQNKSKQKQKKQSAEAAYSFHVFPPIRPILWIRG